MKEQDEAERIYRAIFKTPVPAKVKDRYDRAVEILSIRFSPEENQAFEKSLRQDVDLEALELAARLRNTMLPLVSRFQLMVHLAETLPSHQMAFINPHDQRCRSYASLLFGGFRTLCKFVKGRFLLRRAGNV